MNVVLLTKTNDITAESAEQDEQVHLYGLMLADLALSSPPNKPMTANCRIRVSN